MRALLRATGVWLRSLGAVTWVLIVIVALAYLAAGMGWLKVAAGLSIIGLGILAIWGWGKDADEGVRTPEQFRREREAYLAIDEMHRRGRPLRP